MELLEGITTRRSFRGFKSTPIPKETVKKIFQAVSNSPSYTNTQPWEVAVVSGRKKDELSKILYDLAAQNAVTNPDIPMPQAWPPKMEKRTGEHGARRLAALGVVRDDAEGREKLRLMNFEFYDAPCALFLFTDGALTTWSIFDMGLFAQNVILAAHAFGLGSCLQASLSNYPDAVREFLGMPKAKKLIIGISLGYPDIAAKLNTYRSVKLNPDDFVREYA
ncbi:MAG: nitroreductase [Dehalococcoidales bacterium]|jgi:nitroreductase|nr:nitroreductase [Dehalococcoidales bacterium]MDP6448572.1 nitroreductase [Dehalococcoidales bacterium]